MNREVPIQVAYLAEALPAGLADVLSHHVVDAGVLGQVQLESGLGGKVLAAKRAQVILPLAGIGVQRLQMYVERLHPLKSLSAIVARKGLVHPGFFFERSRKKVY